MYKNEECAQKTPFFRFCSHRCTMGEAGATGSSSSSVGRDSHPRQKQQRNSNVVELLNHPLFRNQMLAVMVLSQHRVSTSKTVSPRIPVGARCTGHVRIICSAICSAAQHSQFDVGARPHLCMND